MFKRYLLLLCAFLAVSPASLVGDGEAEKSSKSFGSKVVDNLVPFMTDIQVSEWNTKNLTKVFLPMSALALCEHQILKNSALSREIVGD
jgi:hypothetical protein